MSKNPSFDYERKFFKKGFSTIVGIDEVGRGSFAGPLVAAAVILPKDFKINGIKDSKLLSPKKREELSKYILKNAQSFAICEIDVLFINKYGVGEATHQAFRNCLEKLNIAFDFVLVDGFKIKDFDNSKQIAIINGDNLSVSIAAASIIAKVYRDNLMKNLHNKFPLYNFLENKGYGTKYHRGMLKEYGLCDAHRTSFNLGKFL